jgi:lipid-A-disaccharide synthase
VRAPRILISAGEPSGDLHGAGVVAALKDRWPHARIYGLGGPRMQEQGAELLAGLDQLAVLGFAEVVRHLPFFLGLLRRVRRELVQNPPDLVLPIDYPGFNMRLARAAKRRGVPVLYYIAPQVWAWHRSRIGQLARDVDRLAVILPFEEALFRDAGANAVFVGHPLLDTDAAPTPRAAFCAALGLDAGRPIIALFPGSRLQEVERHLQLFQRAAMEIQQQRPDVQPVIAAGSGVPGEAYAAVSLPRADDAWSLLCHARAALVKSGTSTLQAALAQTPLVIAYRMHGLSYRIARRVVAVPHIGLANLVAGERVAPEFVQDEATPTALCAALLPLLDDGPERAATLTKLRALRGSLMRPTGTAAAANVAALAAELIEAP